MKKKIKELTNRTTFKLEKKNCQYPKINQQVQDRNRFGCLKH